MKVEYTHNSFVSNTLFSKLEVASFKKTMLLVSVCMYVATCMYSVIQSGNSNPTLNMVLGVGVKFLDVTM